MARRVVPARRVRRFRQAAAVVSRPVTRRSSLRDAASSTGAVSPIAASQALPSASASSTPVASTSRASVMRAAGASAREPSQVLVAAARLRRSTTGSGCAPTAPSVRRAAMRSPTTISRAPPSDVRPASSASARKRNWGVSRANGGRDGTGRIYRGEEEKRRRGEQAVAVHLSHPIPSFISHPPSPIPYIRPMPLSLKIGQPTRSVLWVDDEADLLEPHRLLLADKGYDGRVATNADDAIEMLRRRPYDLVLLDEQMPGKRGSGGVSRDSRVAPHAAGGHGHQERRRRDADGGASARTITRLSREAGESPRQVLSVITRILEGPQIRQQAIARAFVERFRAIELERGRVLDWRGVDGTIRRAHAMGHRSRRGGRAWVCTRSSAGSIRTCIVSSRPTCTRRIRAGCANLEGDRPPLSIDVVSEFVLPVLRRNRKVVFIVMDCLRLDQWRVLEDTARAAFRGGNDALLRDAAHGNAVCAERALQRAVSRRDRGAISRLVGRARRRDAQRPRA